MTGDPQSAIDARTAARYLVQHPLTCAEHDPDTFRLIRRHAGTLDRWFTQRFGDRVHVDADTARLYKSVAPPAARPLRTASGRALRPVEYVMLSLSLAAIASGPDVISLRDLVAAIRSAAAEAEIDLTNDASERRALVTALQWMITQGLLIELHDHVERYGADDEADAVLRIRADRIALVAQPGLGNATSGADLLELAKRRGTPRQQMRARLANDPVLYRSDVEPEHWGELRRRIGEETAILDEMLGLEVEVRAEGVAAIDPAGSLSDRRFPGGGTESHAALLLIDRFVALRSSSEEADEQPASRDAVDGDDLGWLTRAEMVEVITEISIPHTRRWRNEYAENPERLTEAVIDLLVGLRLAEKVDDATESWRARLRPAAARFTTAIDDSSDHDGGSTKSDDEDQPSLW